MNWFSRARLRRYTQEQVERAIGELDRQRPLAARFDKWYQTWGWIAIGVGDIRRWEREGGDSARRALCVASMNRCGHVREAAVRALGRRPGPGAAAFLLWACKDWVEQVRLAARGSLSRMLDPAYAPALLEEHALLNRLRLAQRADLSELLDEVFALLRSGACRGLVDAALGSGETALRLFTAELLRDELPADPALQRRLAEDPDPRVRAWMAAHLHTLPPTDRLRWSSELVRDRSSLVVRRVLWSLDKTTHEAMREGLVHAASHASQNIRSLARAKLPGRSRSEWASHYRARLEQLGEQCPTPGDVGGLGETGGVQDLARLRRLTDSPRSRVRLEALRGVVRLDRAGASGLLLEHAGDSSGRIRRLVSNSLPSGLTEQEESALYDILINGAGTPACETAMRALSNLPGWRAVPPILLGASSPDPDQRRGALDKGARWFEHYGRAGWLKPTGVTLPRLRAALERFEQANPTPAENDAFAWRRLLDWVKETV